MNIIIIGDANSIYIKDYIQHVLLGNYKEIIVITNPYEKFKEFYKRNNIKLYELNNIEKKSWRKIPYNLLQNIKILNRIKKNVESPLIHIHFVTPFSLLRAFYLKTKGKLIASFWGSDIFRANPNSLKLNKLLIKRVDVITVLTDEMLKRFQHDYGRAYDEILFLNKMGLAKLDLIESVQSVNHKKIKENFGIPEEKIIIAVGYNRRKEQQHIKVVKSIKLLPDKERNKLHLIFMMTYGESSKEYIQDLRMELKDEKISYSIYENYLTDDEMIKLEIVTDLFIHAQTTDALSGAVQEQLFLGNMLINPTWLPYQELKKNDIFYWEYEKFEELSEKIIQYIEIKDSKNFIEQLNSNKQKIYNLSSWKAVKEEWLERYN